ncbi:MAG: Tat pathway signal protein [Alphaproteobacteria bacterium]
MKRRGVLIGGAAILAAGGFGIARSFAGMGSADDYAKATAAVRAPLRRGDDVREMVRYATLAANGHNTQPWRFHAAAQSLRIAPDFARRTPIVDPDDHHVFVSLGCAAENMAQAGAALGKPGVVRFDPAGDGALVYDFTAGAPEPSELCDAVGKRQSAREPYDGRTASAGDLIMLRAAARQAGVNTTLITERSTINKVRDLVIAGNSAQMADAKFVTELKQWMRFNPRAALAHGDGLYAASSGNPTLPDFMGAPMFDLAFKPEAENEKYEVQLNTSAGVAVFVGDKADPDHWTRVGQACQRFALQATALGMKLSFINQPVEAPAFREDLASLVGAKGMRPDILMRFGYGEDLPFSPRRPIAAVFSA